LTLFSLFIIFLFLRSDCGCSPLEGPDPYSLFKKQLAEAAEVLEENGGSSRKNKETKDAPETVLEIAKSEEVIPEVKVGA
jgi:hypothetical protein